MKGKIIIAAAVLLLVVLGIVFWEPNHSESDDQTVVKTTKSDFSNSDTLPGFKSRREKSGREIDPGELKPLNPPLDIPRVVLEEGQGIEDFTPEQIAQIEEQQRQIADLIARNKMNTFEVKLADLVKGMQLDVEQENALRAHFAAIQGDIVSGDLQAYGRLEQVLRGDGLDAVLKEILNKEQLDLYQSVHERQRTERAESAAATEMTHLNSLLALNKEQQGQVSEILRADALEKELAGQRAGNVDEQERFANNLMEQMQAAGTDTNPLEILIRGRLQQGRNSTLKKLEGLLSPEQLEVYRRSLEARDGDMAQFRNSLDAFGKGGSR